jgi:predicted nucleic acid-binding protein
MGLVEELQGQTVGFDTSPFIFFIERHSEYVDLIRPLFAAADRGELKIVTSSVTLIEVLVQPIRRNDELLAYRYNDILLSSPNISTTPVTPVIAQLAAELRAEYALKTADAVQLATAVSHGAAAFLTNDRDFRDVPGIKIIRLLDLKTAQ